MSRQTTRRTLMAAAGASLPAFALGGPVRAGGILGASERIRVAVAGIHGRGASHIDEYTKIKDVEVATLVDPDSRTYAGRVKTVEDRTGKKPAVVADIRRALDDKGIDAVSVATTNQWHALIGIWACQAGKDAYIEKPISHNVFEGRKLVEAARKYSRIVQHGTQQRSSGGRAREMAAIHSGKYGKLLVAKAYCCKPRWTIGFKEPKAPPPELDWNLWLGPAPEQPYHENLVHYNWHWFWDFGDGDTGNQGVHEMDVARWGIKGATLPKSVWSLGGRFAYEDQGQTPNTQLAVMDFGEAILVFETRGLVGKHKDFPNKVDNEFYTTEGVIRDGKFYAKNAPEKAEKIEGPDVEVSPGGSFGSFIGACRSRRWDEINGNALEGHYSAALCHLANISYRLGNPVPFDKPKHALGDNAQVVESFETIQANLTTAGVKLQETQYRLGPVLAVDAAAEKFVGAPEADLLLTRDYRKPFVVPKEV